MNANVINIKEEIPLIQYNECVNDCATKAKLFFYDAGDGMSLPILHAILKIIFENSKCKLELYSAYILPDNLNRIYFEAINKKIIQKIFNRIRCVNSISNDSQIIEINDYDRYFINPVKCLNFVKGQIVVLNNPEFHQQYGQIVDIEQTSAKILIKTRPHIDYELLSKMKLNSQYQLNSRMDIDYRAPEVSFRIGLLQTERIVLPIWNRQVEGIKWDGKIFIGEFQYIWLDYEEIYFIKYESIPDDIKELFEINLSSFEIDDKQFLGGMKHIVKEYFHQSNIVLNLIENKGKPSWSLNPKIFVDLPQPDRFIVTNNPILLDESDDHLSNQSDPISNETSNNDDTTDFLSDSSDSDIVELPQVPKINSPVKSQITLKSQKHNQISLSPPKPKSNLLIPSQPKPKPVKQKSWFASTDSDDDDLIEIINSVSNNPTKPQIQQQPIINEKANMKEINSEIYQKPKINEKTNLKEKILQIYQRPIINEKANIKEMHTSGKNVGKYEMKEKNHQIPSLSLNGEKYEVKEKKNSTKFLSSSDDDLWD